MIVGMCIYIYIHVYPVVKGAFRATLGIETKPHVNQHLAWFKVVGLRSLVVGDTLWGGGGGSVLIPCPEHSPKPPTYSTLHYHMICMYVCMYIYIYSHIQTHVRNIS